MLFRSGPDGIYGSGDDGVASVSAINSGTQPLVIVGTDAQPIQIDGPVVVEGDVIIKGVVSGQGTIYAGRNVHIVGDITYTDPPVWPSLDRNTRTGEISDYRDQQLANFDFGSVCNNGQYVPASAGPGETRCQ